MKKFEGLLLPFARRSIWALVVLAFVVSKPLAHSATPEDQTREYKVKAGFLYNFAKFVEWPKNTFPTADSPLRIGVFEDDAAAPILQGALANKVANGRPIDLKLLPTTNALPADCHVLFLSRSKEDRIDQIITHARGRPILTIGEVEQFAQRGGIINFVRKGDAFRFEVNLEMAEQAGLKISANLASMATIVKSRK
jgi:hypothetical protein